MKPFRPRYTPQAADQIRKLHPEVKREIRKGIRMLLTSPLSGHALQFELSGYRSYRIHTYRVIYQMNEKETMLDVVFVGPRRTVYEELRSLLQEKH